ncbi:MAG: RNA-splicing ligase RtcB [Chloroflexi bacterium]|nr:RNA-splicing ligase RtcB [Chloroflexota bacterium]
MVTKQDLIRIEPYLYEIPKSYRKDMRVPARFYADAVLLEKALQDRSLEQLVNTATLPGVVKWALAMPDIHQGYGFPIGGVVATQLPHGVISPGGVGYDINCLAGDTIVLHRHGYTRRIDHMADHWRNERLTCFRLEEDQMDTAKPVLWFGRPPHAPVLHMVTETGRDITATADHPFWTPDGMVDAGDLRPGDRVALYPFDGVPYEPPSDEVIVDEDSLRAFLRTWGKGSAGNAVAQIINVLKKRGLLPLRYSSPALPFLIKLLGYIFGDGAIYVQRGGKAIVAFYGKAADLEDIRRDVREVGFTPSRVYTRRRTHAIRTTYGTYTFDHTAAWFKVSSTALAALLAYLGAPVGAKARQAYDAPAWLDQAPRWQKRLFLAALFGAELSRPQPVSGHGYNLAAPVLSMNKRASVAESGHVFLEHLAQWLAEFDIQTHPIQTRTEQTNPDGEPSIRMRLVISAEPENLIRLWGQVGYEYNRERGFLAAVAVHYLRTKQRHIAERERTAEQARNLARDGVPLREIVTTLEGPIANRRFIERSIYGGRSSSPRVAQTFPTFQDFLAEVTAGLGTSGMVWDRIVRIEEIPYQGQVYDFTLDHPDHNFVANGFVVSNCGVRLLASELSEEEVRPYLEDLATALYHYVPSGVGVKGFLRLKNKELDRIMVEGARWALERGYARPEDLLHTEEGGSMKGADPSKVSKKARERGRAQVGTLGAGNHFAELDVVDEIFDVEVAAAFGLWPGQVVLQIHCGSRGFGHQICTDYVQKFQKAIHKYGITLPDRELVCAPFDSPEGQDYFAAMVAAANYAWTNRQLLAHQARQAFEEVLKGKVADYDLRQVYDVAHNIAKREVHDIDGRPTEVLVHRKGATRAFPPGHPAIPEDYRDYGQPVLVPGSMGTASWVLVGTPTAMEKTFGSSCHGAGRMLSRRAATRQVRGQELIRELGERGIVVRAGSMRGVAEEAPFAYKDVDRVVEVVQGAGIARKVARLRPIAVVKG